MAKEHIYIIMKMFFMVTLSMVKNRESGSINMQARIFTKVNGETI